jgi:hypothetical protein
MNETDQMPIQPGRIFATETPRKYYDAGLVVCTRCHHVSVVYPLWRRQRRPRFYSVI